jgi:putative zinc finger/helix-turn-helix YgiT family protein
MPENNQPATKDRPFPWRCSECGKKEMYPQATDYIGEVKHDGRPYTIHIPDLEIPTCRNCGAQLFTARADDRIIAALREKVGLLIPQVIRERRTELGLSQQGLADQLGVAKETISRWETGALIQSRAMDNLLRLYFDSEEVRERLRRRPIPIETTDRALSGTS